MPSSSRFTPDMASDLNKLNTQVTTGRKFMTASENPAGAVKAFHVRRDLSKVEGYQNNIQHAKSALTNAESALMHMQEIMKEANVKILSSINSTKSEEDRKIIATELEHLQEQLLQTLNSNASGVYYFGGSNTDIKPFTVDEITGDLIYNGQNLNQFDALSQVDQDKLTKDSQYVDIGLGVQFDSSNDIDRRTVFEYSTPGINIVGHGKTNLSYDGNSEQVSNNLYNILGHLIEEFNKPDESASPDPDDAYSTERANALLGHFQDNSTRIVTSMTDIGAKTSYLDFMKGRYDSSTLDMQERQMDVEAADPAETIIKFESQKVAYHAALQMGAQIIQPSIFDFIR